MSLYRCLVFGFACYWAHSKYCSLRDEEYGVISSVFWSMFNAALATGALLCAIQCFLFVNIITSFLRNVQSHLQSTQNEMVNLLNSQELQQGLNSLATHAQATMEAQQAAARQQQVPARSPESRDRIVLSQPPAGSDTAVDLGSSDGNPARVLEPGDCSVCMEKCSGVSDHVMIDVSMFGQHDRQIPDMQKKTVVTNCKHTFHFTCLNTWLATSEYCPTCRQPLNFENCDVALSIKSL